MSNLKKRIIVALCIMIFALIIIWFMLPTKVCRTALDILQLKPNESCILRRVK